MTGLDKNKIYRILNWIYIAHMPIAYYYNWMMSNGVLLSWMLNEIYYDVHFYKLTCQ